MIKPTFALDFERPLMALESKIAELKELSGGAKVDFTDEILKLERKARKLQAEIFSDLTSWQIVQLARHPNRPYTLDYLKYLFTDFFEIEGDRRFAADRAIVAGFARFDGAPVLVMGHQKGRSTKENMVRNFGMPRPEGYRKARRLFDLAERFRLPVLIFIDTPGAYPGIGAEERGQAEAIAVNLEVMSGLSVPTISTVIGEGGVGRRAGARRHQPHPDAPVQLVQRHLAGELQLDPLPRRRAGQEERRRAQADRPRPVRVRHHRRDRAASRPAAPTATTPRPPATSARPSAATWPSCGSSRPSRSSPTATGSTGPSASSPRTSRATAARRGMTPGAPWPSSRPTSPR